MSGINQVHTERGVLLTGIQSALGTAATVFQAQHKVSGGGYTSGREVARKTYADGSTVGADSFVSVAGGGNVGQATLAGTAIGSFIELYAALGGEYTVEEITTGPNTGKFRHRVEYGDQPRYQTVAQDKFVAPDNDPVLYVDAITNEIHLRSTQGDKPVEIEKHLLALGYKSLGGVAFPTAQLSPADLGRALLHYQTVDAEFQVFGLGGRKHASGIEFVLNRNASAEQTGEATPSYYAWGRSQVQLIMTSVVSTELLAKSKALRFDADGNPSMEVPTGAGKIPLITGDGVYLGVGVPYGDVDIADLGEFATEGGSRTAAVTIDGKPNGTDPVCYAELICDEEDLGLAA